MTSPAQKQRSVSDFRFDTRDVDWKDFIQDNVL